MRVLWQALLLLLLTGHAATLPLTKTRDQHVLTASEGVNDHVKTESAVCSDESASKADRDRNTGTPVRVNLLQALRAYVALFRATVVMH